MTKLEQQMLYLLLVKEEAKNPKTHWQLQVKRVLEDYRFQHSVPNEWSKFDD